MPEFDPDGEHTIRFVDDAELVYVKLVTVVEGDQKAPFSIASV